jgi:sulfur-oxidizing protein SoxY
VQFAAFASVSGKEVRFICLFYILFYTWYGICSFFQNKIQQLKDVNGAQCMLKQRRTFLQTSMAAGTLAVAAGAGLLIPRSVLAAWPEKAFKAKKYPDALQALAGSEEATNSDAVKVKAPDIAENGAVVSVSVTTSLPKVENIAVFVPVNTFPLSASFEMSDATEGFITARFKMAKTSDVIAIVKADGKLYTAKKSVKVTLGGCGG